MLYRKRAAGDFGGQQAKRIWDQGGASVEQRRYEYDGIICEVPDNGGAYVIFPWNIREEFGKGRVKVHA